MKIRSTVLKWLGVVALAAMVGGGLVIRARADEPKPDPAGTATGNASDVQDAGGTHFVVSEPAVLSDDDKKDADKVKAYGEAKKAYDEYVARSKAEPLAVQLADAVGHNRVAINFTWTLVTGFLV